MGFFNRTVGKTESNNADSLRRKIEMADRQDSAQLVAMIEDYERNSDKLIIKPYNLFLDVVEMILASRVEPAIETIRYGEWMYPNIFIYDEATPDFAGLKDMYLDMFGPKGIAAKRIFNPVLYSLFRDKMNYVRWASIVPVKNTFLKKGKDIVEFAMKIRAYFPDEDSFTVNLMYVTDKYLSNEADEKIFEENLNERRRMAGIYDVSEERILTAEHKIADVQKAAVAMKDSLSLVEERAKALNEISENTVKTADDYCQGTLVRMQSRIRGLSEEMEKAHHDFMEIQRQSILEEKEELVNSIFTDSQLEVNELKKNINQMILSAKMELRRATRESDDIMSKVQAYLENDERLKKTLANAQDSKKLNDRIDKLMVLNDAAIDMAASQAEMVQKEENKPKAAKASVQAEKKEAPTVVTMQKVVAATENTAPVVAAAADVFVESEEIAPVTYLLDESVPYQERYAEAMKRKALMESKGEHFHTMFDDVLCAVMENANPYLIGPSGCGKTFMIHQIQEILGLESIDIGYINEEYDILGFQTANGGYSRPNFYRCYKYGKIAFCDELDNGNSRATVKLNSFLSNNKDACYSFPNGENVKRHPNFRIVAAGNTTGNGADENYNSREKIEESVQQRFTPIFVNYDYAVEKTILAAYPAWFDFVVAFRNATNAWSKYSHSGAPGIITTRDTARIRRYLDNRSFPPSKIIEYEFIQTKEPEYLAFLAKEMNKSEPANKDCKKLISFFNDRVEQIRAGKDPSRIV